MNNDQPRLIEVAFPLKQASLDSVHEKNVRHGHISTLHIWPARRPLAACRAALVCTLLPDPGDPEKRTEILERLAGKLVKTIERKKMPGGKVVESEKWETVGGILHWKRETENKADLDWFRNEIRKAYGGRAPRVLDPFAGGGAIPLEAMRLGCEATAIDINPVAWFILKCTLEYPQKLAGQKRPLPDFVLKDRDFMESYFKAQGFKGASLRTQLEKLGLGKKGDEMLPGLEIESHTLEADLAWHVRAWGWWVLQQARRDLARFYPVYADFQPLKDVEDWREKHPRAQREMRLVSLKDDGTPDIDALNAELIEELFAKDKQFKKDAQYRADATREYFENKKNPRWVAKPTVAYLWARTVQCKNCRATIPLLKTRWLCKKDERRVLLTMEPKADKTGVVCGVQTGVPRIGGNTAQRREHDRRIGMGTMSRSGAWCPCCGQAGTVSLRIDDIRQEGLAGRLGTAATATVIDGLAGKQYRPTTEHEIDIASRASEHVPGIFNELPFGVPHEAMPIAGALGMRVPLYGFDQWSKLFTPRQLASLAVLARGARDAYQASLSSGYPDEWREALSAYLALTVNRVLSTSSTNCTWNVGPQSVRGTYARYALPITWDFVELNPLSEVGAACRGSTDLIGQACSFVLSSMGPSSVSTILCESAIKDGARDIDVIVTDPPYYDAIPYSDLMDFFYIWLRRTVHGINAEVDHTFRDPLGPKWSHEANDGELIDDASRHAGSNARSKQVYEDGMSRSFQACARALRPEGRLVIVFANKQPDAWETLVSAIIRAGFVVDGSWPIQTEREARTRALASAALASSVWLVCKKRSETSRPGWDNNVLRDMRERITTRLREFWDAGIRGPDFVWAATGPALEAYSKHPVVKKANEPGKLMEVSEFLKHVRRIVVDFVVGRVLTHDGSGEVAGELDDVTTYYLLHRHDFGMDDAPAGPCILYAISCGMSEGELADKFDILVRTGGKAADEEEEEADVDADADAEVEGGTGSTFRLKPWKQRSRKNMGYDAVADSARARRAREGPGLFPEADNDWRAGTPTPPKEVPLIDAIHRLMHLWKAGDVHKVDDYLDVRGLRRSQLFLQVLQALIELSPERSDERSLLESISNHVAARGMAPEIRQAEMFAEPAEIEED